MPVIFKLVGGINSKVLEIRRDMVGVLRLSNITAIFEIYGLSSDELENVRFVAHNETIKTNDKVFNVSSDDNFVVFVFSAVKEVKEKLIIIFSQNATNKDDESVPVLTQTRPLIGTIQDSTTLNKFTKVDEKPDEEMTHPIDAEENNIEPVLDDAIVAEINIQSAKLFENEDFKHLVRIYYTNQDVMKKFFSFINNGDIVKIEIPQDSSKQYEEEIQILKSLGITETNEQIKQCLIAFNGHLNLTLRALLVRKAVLFSPTNTIEEV
jgi:hypothetical protein